MKNLILVLIASLLLFLFQPKKVYHTFDHEIEVELSMQGTLVAQSALKTNEDRCFQTTESRPVVLSQTDGVIPYLECNVGSGYRKHDNRTTRFKGTLTNLALLNKNALQIIKNPTVEDLLNKESNDRFIIDSYYSEAVPSSPVSPIHRARAPGITYLLIANYGKVYSYV